MLVEEIVPLDAIDTFEPAVKAPTTLAVLVTFAPEDMPSSLLFNVDVKFF